MRSPQIARRLGLASMVLALASSALAQFTINGVADKTVYQDIVTLNVPAQAGYAYGLFLNGTPVHAEGDVVLNRADYYELSAWRTNLATPFDVTNRLIRFVVEDSARLGTERGLPSQTPWPVVQSSSNEFAGARLRLIVPESFPVGYEIPVVAWAVKKNGRAVRANGPLIADGHPSIQVKRGVGSGFLAATNPAGPLSYAPRLQGIQTNKVINLEGSTSWTPVSGILGAATEWPENSRIWVTTNLTLDAGSTLTVRAGCIVLLNPRVNITNNGAVIIQGTVDRPVVFMPISRAQPWGGFFMRTNTGLVDATGVIFTGSGADPTGSAGHRKEQCLFQVASTPRVTLTDSAAIYLAGQLGHAQNGGTFTFTRFLMQRCPTGGQYTGATFVVNDSAFIDCPDDSSNFVDGDNDALYLVSGSYSFTNTLFGWTKDDGIDSGGIGYAPLCYQSCWFEAIFHEGNSLSGYKDTRAWDTVYMDCGQGLEAGYYSPTGRVERCLFSVCKVGVRHGDNYTNIGSYDGNITATNSIFLHNHRSGFGYNWLTTGWTNAWGQMFINDNLFTVADTNFPDNAVWNSANDAWRLAAFQTAPIGHVGVEMAVRSGETSLAGFPDGIPVGLSSFCTNEVRVDYVLEATDGTRNTGTLRFRPGRVRRFITPPPNFTGVLRVALTNAQNADLTGIREFLFQNLPPVLATNVALVTSNSMWRYLDTGGDPGTAWRLPGYDDSAWSNNLAELGFADGDERTPIRRVGTNGQSTISFYFRQRFNATPAALSDLALWLLRDDGGVVYLNGTEVYRSPSVPAAPAIVTYQTLANAQGSNAPPDNTVDQTSVNPALLAPGDNLVAVEIHQHRSDSSDVSFNFSLTGVSQSLARLNWSPLGGGIALYWSDASYILEHASSVTGPWTTAASISPVTVTLEATRFYRLKR